MVLCSNRKDSDAFHGAATGSASCMIRSYRQATAHSVGVHVGAAPARHNFAALHHQVLVGERAGEVVVLLDQQDRHLAGRGERADRALDLLDDRRLDALGRLVEDQQARLHRQRAADGELLLLPARQVAAAAPEHALQHREHLEDARRDGGRAHQQVLFHREAREDLAPLRHVAQAGARTLVGFRLHQVELVEPDVAAARGHEAHQGLEQRGLAHAVATEQRGHLARRKLEAHVAQDVAAAVVLIESLNDHWKKGSGPFYGKRVLTPFSVQRPRYTSITRSSFFTWSIGPSASTLPSCSTVTLRAMVSMKAMSCSTTTSECVPASERNSSAVRSVSASLMPATGSSSSSTLGSCISSMPISSHCFWPCDSKPAVRSADSRRPMSIRVAPTWSFCCKFIFETRVARTRLSAFIARSRFSNTVSCSKMVGFWNLRPMPACAIWASVMRVRSAALPNTARPSSGRVLPVITSIIVVLPAPFGPITQRSSPESIMSERLLSALKPSKLTLMPSRYRTVPCPASAISMAC